MNVIRYSIAVPVFCVAVLFLGFGCATNHMLVSTPIPASVQIVTNAPPPPPPAAIAPATTPIATTPIATTPIATTPAVYVPDMTHAGEPLRAGVLVWDNLMESVDAAADQAQAHFTFNFTNIAVLTDITLVTNVTDSSTNIVATTNSITPIPVTILSVHPSCGCTTAQLPPLPWIVDAGTNGQIGITVDLRGKTGTLFKTVNVVTDKGNLNLSVRVTIFPPVVPTMTDADRARALDAAKADRQAVFKDDCATCHVKPGVGKYGQALYDVSCGICHDGEHRATMVPDLHAIKTPTNEDFWRTWIMHGKPGSLMPAFATAEGGPLNDVQIASLAAYLNAAIPSKVPPPPQ